MKFKDYLNELNKLNDNNPDIGDLDIVASIDYGVQDYFFVRHPPSMVHVDGTVMLTQGEIEQGECKGKINAILIT